MNEWKKWIVELSLMNILGDGVRGVVGMLSCWHYIVSSSDSYTQGTWVASYIGSHI